MQNNEPSIKLEDVVDDIERILEETGLTPDEITVDKYSRAGGRFDGRRLKRLGGFQAIVRSEFLGDVQRDTYTNARLKRNLSYVRKLEQKVGDWEHLREQVYESFKRAFTQSAPILVSPNKKTTKRRPSDKARANCVLISDIHLGLRIDPNELMNNGYDWNIAARRLGKLAYQVATYKQDHRDECRELNVCLGGDLGQGVIHWQSDAGTDLITYQVIGIVSYLTQMIDYWRQSYDKINVYCTPDNHMRLVHKGAGRATAQKFDSFATMVHHALQMAFREADDVKIVIPKTAITTFDVLGHKYGLTHGDGHITTGNVGHQVNVKSITDKVLRLNASVTDGKKYSAILLGHVHVAMNMTLNETGTELIVNGTGSGTDGYAESIGFFSTIPMQVMWEATREYAVGDVRKVRLDDADQDASYEEIIEPYKYTLTL